MNVALSLGGVAIALAILWFNLRPWWKGSRDPKALLPYASGAGIGSLSTICVGGALGWGAAGIAGLVTSGGNTGVEKITGTSGAATLPTGRMGTLTQEGAVVAFLLLGGVILLYKTSGKQDKRRIIGGAVTFAVLGFLPGVASMLSWWPDLVNEAGAYGRDLLSTGDI
ncbi:hypothetical protein [Streptomyces olivaceus]|uniref:hypothetical protein n=1 Tax=Streptomyces olivaceus TaxID=47716 RepID=UPI0022EE8A87|nr:hypothetical protein [Streptomyces olivaceus]GHI91726.1 hypothetical protein TPA0905_11970 [Streptomyces olivaceus]